MILVLSITNSSYTTTWCCGKQAISRHVNTKTFQMNPLLCMSITKWLTKAELRTSVKLSSSNWQKSLPSFWKPSITNPVTYLVTSFWLYSQVKSLLKWWFKAEVTIRSLYADLENLSSNMHINNETTNSQVSNKGTKVVAILISLMQTIMPIFTKHFSERWLSCDHVLTIRVHNVCL